MGSDRCRASRRRHGSGTAEIRMNAGAWAVVVFLVIAGHSHVGMSRENKGGVKKKFKWGE